MFYRVNSINLIQPRLDPSNDCITQYNHFYGLVEKLYPNKTSGQKMNLSLQMVRICKNKQIMNLYLEGLKEHKEKENKVKKKREKIYMKIKKFFSFK